MLAGRAAQGPCIECPPVLIDVFHAGPHRRPAIPPASPPTPSWAANNKRSLVNEQQLAAALAEQEVGHVSRHDPGRSRGAPLDAVREVLSRQIANTLVAAKLEASGRSLLMSAPTRRSGPVTGTRSRSCSTSFWEVLLRRRMLGQPSTVLVRNGDYNSTAPQPAAHGSRRVIVLLHADGTRTAKEVMQASGLEEDTDQHPRRWSTRGCCRRPSGAADRRRRRAAGAPGQRLGRTGQLWTTSWRRGCVRSRRPSDVPGGATCV